MAQTRRENREAKNRNITIVLSENGRHFVAWLLPQLKLDKDGAYKAAGVIDGFDLEEFTGYDKESRFSESEYGLSAYEVRWLLEQSREFADGKNLIAAQVKGFIEVTERLQAGLDKPYVSAEEE